ncbi:MAG: cytochrome c [Ramlibacter sp.]|nr:cytochrome c [Ramlibacter sp.]
MSRFRLLGALALWLAAAAAPVRAAPATFEDTLAQRTLACTACHGAQGRAGPDGYYPRIAGKPAGYLYNQLLNFREGRRHYGLMAGLLEPLSNDYLMEMARHFAALEVPYPPPAPRGSTTAQAWRRGEALALEGDAARKIPACVSCHGAALTGVQPATPGLVGLPRDYLNAQLGAWRAGQRQAHAPDCMGQIARALSLDDINAVATWLAAQPVPRDSHPAAALPRPPVMACGAATPPKAIAVATPQAPTAPATPDVTGTTAQVARGAYLARAGNCMACHTVAGAAPYSGGRAIDTPFGRLHTSNLTPDKATGIGLWTADDFWRAMHEGKARDGRLLYPAFPYPSYTRVTRADSDALHAYLMSLPPVARANTPHALRWPYSTQTALWAWRLLSFSPQDFEPDASQSAAWNRGAYLVQGLGHCAACHAPRNALGATRNPLNLAGGMIPMQNWYAPSLGADAEAGVARWPLEQIVALLKTGVSPQASVLGPMAEVVQASTQHLSDADLGAMATYLRSLPAAPAPTPKAPAAVNSRLAQRGAELYDKHCVQCHGDQGQGVPGAYPRLAGNRAVTLGTTANLVQIVLNGGFAPATAGNPKPFGMPPYVLLLNDADTAAVLTHIRNAWGNHAAGVSELEVSQQRGSTQR